MILEFLFSSNFSFLNGHPTLFSNSALGGARKVKMKTFFVCKIRTSLFLKCAIVTSDDGNRMSTLKGLKVVAQSLPHRLKTIVFERPPSKLKIKIRLSRGVKLKARKLTKKTEELKVSCNLLERRKRVRIRQW